MCGICGINWKDGELVRRMAAEMAHRGPDQDGVFCSEGISLAHRRLSIIDLSEHGRQPMANEDGTVQLVFNGEIYNFQELRNALLAKGHRFANQSDSEVIVHGYEEYGVDVVRKLRGMFAFAIWDAPKERLFLARDRIGIKPLYYYSGGGKFVFASEIKSILQVSSVPRRLNHQAMYDYLGFEFVPAPDTMFADIKKLPAGCCLLLEKNGKVSMEQYWDLSFRIGAVVPSFEEAVEREIAMLDEAVKSHLVSDVPLGVFLSGGLDSSTIVALMRRHIPGTLRTFTIGYEDKTFSELEYAKQVADVFGTEHHVLMIDSLKPEYIEKSLWHLDEPMTDLSSIPLMLVCAKAKEFATVCLSGEGGDEIFAGYDRFKASRLNRIFGLIPSPIRKHMIGPLMNGFPDRPQKKGALNMLKRFVEGSNLPPEAEHLRWQYFLTSEFEQKLFSPAFKQNISLDPFRRVREHAARCDATDKVNLEIYLDTRFMMADGVLMKVDKMSMANSLEIRVPFLDHEVVEYNASLPGSWKLKGMTTKHILRAALKGILPDNIVHRGKQGYSLPVKHLLRDQLREYMISLLNESPVVRENMNMEYVHRLIREHVEMKHNHNHVLWGLMNIAIWHRRFKVN
ncbi:MAG: asparagine synthase (glutamine-hydrolyzing) [bacterium]